MYTHHHRVLPHEDDQQSRRAGATDGHVNNRSWHNHFDWQIHQLVQFVSAISVDLLAHPKSET